MPSELTHAVVADTTDIEALRQLGVPDFPRAVVGIGTDLEASILTTAVLVDLGVPHIWAKATSRQHGRILERIGAHHVVLPEHDMGERVAHLVTGPDDRLHRVRGRLRNDQDGPRRQRSSGSPLSESGVRTRHGITIVGVKRPGQPFTYATQDTVVQAGDLVIVSGRIDSVEAFANRG